MGSGALVKDKLFFYAMYEGRKVEPQSTNNAGTSFDDGESNDGFWGLTMDWQVTDNNLLSLLAFSNKNRFDTDTYELRLRHRHPWREAGRVLLRKRRPQLGADLDVLFHRQPVDAADVRP